MHVATKGRETNDRVVWGRELGKGNGVVHFLRLPVVDERREPLIALNRLIDSRAPSGVRTWRPEDHGHQHDERCKEDFQ